MEDERQASSVTLPSADLPDGAAAARDEEPAGSSEGEQQLPPVHTILKLYENKIRQYEGTGQARSSGFGLAFSKSKRRQSDVRRSERVNLSEESDVDHTNSDGVKTINMLRLARRARVPLAALIASLADNGDRRNVQLRSEDGPVGSDGSDGEGAAEDDPLLGVSAQAQPHSTPMKYVDVSFNEFSDDPCGVSGVGSRPGATALSLATSTGFGLLLSPGSGLSQTSQEPSGARDAFEEWLGNAPAVPKEQQVSVAVELPSVGRFDNEAFLVLDPTSVRMGAPQWVFAVACTDPEEMQQQQRDCTACASFPSEVANVTLFCEQAGDASQLANVVLSVELSRPAWAWLALFTAVVCAGLTTPFVAALHTYGSVRSPCVSFWWATSLSVFSLCLAVPMLLFQRLKPSELDLLKRREGLVPLACLGALFAAYILLWTSALNERDKKKPTHVGTTVQALGLNAYHPLSILLYRVVRRQQVFAGEFLGAGMIAVGFLVLSLPSDGSWTDSWGADLRAAASSICLAAFLVCGKVIASQIPTFVVLKLMAWAGIVVTLIAALAGGHSSKLSFGECIGGWKSEAFYARMFVSLILVSGLQWSATVHSLRYHHPLVVSMALCFSTLFATFSINYLFSDVNLVGALSSHGVVPGILVAVVGCIIGLYTSVVKRQVCVASVSVFLRFPSLFEHAAALLHLHCLAASSLSNSTSRSRSPARTFRSARGPSTS